MSEREIIMAVAAFVIGFVLKTVLGWISGLHRERSRIINLDCGYDPTNYINQAHKSWQPFEVDGYILYRLQ